MEPMIRLGGLGTIPPGRKRCGDRLSETSLNIDRGNLRRNPLWRRQIYLIRLINLLEREQRRVVVDGTSDCARQ